MSEKAKINKQRRVIWTNDDYPEWYDCMIKDEGLHEEEVTPELYGWECENWLSDELCNLDKEVNGYIVAFADLGFWYGRRNGAKLIGTNVKDILSSSYGCDNATFYCDPYNVKFDGSHHDGSHYIMFRIAKNYEAAKKLVNRIAYKGMTEEQFRKATKSLRKYVASIYGW